jgi:hypothetical protein
MEQTFSLITIYISKWCLSKVSHGFVHKNAINTQTTNHQVENSINLTNTLIRQYYKYKIQKEDLPKQNLLTDKE